MALKTGLIVHDGKLYFTPQTNAPFDIMADSYYKLLNNLVETYFTVHACTYDEQICELSCTCATLYYVGTLTRFAYRSLSQHISIQEKCSVTVSIASRI